MRQVETYILYFFLASFISSESYGMSQGAGIYVGLMQQPTSSYFHQVVGGYADAYSDDRSLFLRLGRIQRPEFRSAGFIDQEIYHFGMVGTSLVGAKWFDLEAAAGVGQVTGSLTPVSTELDTRFFEVSGSVLSLEGKMIWEIFEVGLSHQLFTGFRTQDQIDINVVWPYVFMQLRVGLNYHW